MKKLIIIPAYNEEMSIPTLVKSVTSIENGYDYVIINDGSTDQTRQLCKNAGYTVINLAINSGIGVAVQTGYKYALENNYDIAIQIDGDGQHDVNYIKSVVEPIEKGEADVVIGSRFVNREGYQSSRTRRLGIQLLSGFIWVCAGIKVKDVTSGFRAANRQFIRVFAEDYSKDYPEPEAIVTTRMYGGKILEVPVVMRERGNGVSSINLKKSFYYMIKVTLAIFIKRLSYGLRRNYKGKVTK